MFGQDQLGWLWEKEITLRLPRKLVDHPHVFQFRSGRLPADWIHMQAGCDHFSNSGRACRWPLELWEMASQDGLNARECITMVGNMVTFHPLTPLEGSAPWKGKAPLS